MSTEHPAYLRIDQVLARTGHSKTTLYEAIKRGRFPAPVKRGRSSLWIEAEVNAAIAREQAELVRARDQRAAA